MTPEKRNAKAQLPVLAIDDEGTKRWTVDGVLHREDGPAMEDTLGSKWWYHHGQCHRDDGPAIEVYNGLQYWYCHDKIHRDDGPAIEHTAGVGRWYLHGQSYTKPEWLREVLKNRPLTPRQHALLDALSENWFGTPDQLYETVCAWATFDPSGRDRTP